ncbi:MAG: PAS domain S-box protein [Pseudomonadota bacterium]
MKNTVPAEIPTFEEQTSSKEQLLKYANDIAKLYKEERVHRKALEAANSELHGEILERMRLQAELQRSERAYRSLFEESQEAIYITSREGIIVDANNAFFRLVGYEREELLGSNILSTYDDPSVRAAIRTLAEENDGLKDFELRLRRKDGIICDCMLACSVRKSPSGSILGYQEIVRDVTAQERTRRTLELAGRMEALAHMAGGIAHEIRNPLAISSSAAQLLRNSRLEPQLIEECVEKVLSGIHRASVVIENLLVFAKPLTDYTLTQVNLVEIMAATVRGLASTAAGKNITIISDLDSECLLVKSNAELLHRVFLNLFLNGFAAMPQGGSLTVSVQRNALEAMARIKDSGERMSKEQCDRAFDPFYNNSATGGTGLGLSVSYSIVRYHGGTIQAESDRNLGSAFLVTLPLCDPGSSEVVLAGE